MVVRIIQCKIGDEGACLEPFRDKLDQKEVVVLSQVDFHCRFAGRKEWLCRRIMAIVRSDPCINIFLLNPFQWNSDSESTIGSNNSSQSDSEDEDIGNLFSKKSHDLLLSLVSWFVVHSRRGSQQLIIMSSQQVPRSILLGACLEIFEPMRSGESSETPMVIGMQTVPAESGCILVRGPLGSGKTGVLFELEKSHTVVRLLTHEIINCELGESGQIIRRAFRRASSSQSGVVVMDDADLILNTSGRIVKEVIEEIGACITEFGPGTKFVFSMDESGHIDDFILGKVDFTIDL